jgi:phosphoribosylanthranilate isomerase
VPAPPRIKICGLTRLEDAEHAVDAGAWAIGLIFFPRSSRAVALEPAQEISRRLRRRAEIAGVFVNATIDEIVATSELVPLSLVQLHGDEGPMYATEVARRTGARVIKAARVASKADVQALDAFRTQDFHLLDTLVPGEAGGTGRTFDWSLARHRVSSVPLILSGGLTPENVGEAIGQVGPWGVDVASGTEREPGVKDPAKVEAFVAAVRATAQEPSPESAVQEAAR